jgi:hypothetical protein
MKNLFYKLMNVVLSIIFISSAFKFNNFLFIVTLATVINTQMNLKAL